MTERTVAMNKANHPLNPAPCVYKHSCGIEICMKDDCPEYVPKKRGQKFYGEEDSDGQAD